MVCIKYIKINRDAVQEKEQGRDPERDPQRETLPASADQRDDGVTLVETECDWLGGVWLWAFTLVMSGVVKVSTLHWRLPHSGSAAWLNLLFVRIN